MTLTIGQIRGWAYGVLHLSRADFHSMRPGEFWEAMQAHQEEKDADRHHVGELIRGAALRIMNLMSTPESRISDPAKFWKMPWDPEDSQADVMKRLAEMPDDEREKQAKDFITRIGWDGDE